MLQINLVVKVHGIFELIMSIYTFATTFANSGISLAATRIVAEEIDGNNAIRPKNCNEKMYFI